MLNKRANDVECNDKTVQSRAKHLQDRSPRGGYSCIYIILFYMLPATFFLHFIFIFKVRAGTLSLEKPFYFLPRLTRRMTIVCLDIHPPYYRSFHDSPGLFLQNARKTCIA